MSAQSGTFVYGSLAWDRAHGFARPDLVVLPRLYAPGIFCVTCGSPVVWNRILGVTFCLIHGLEAPMKGFRSDGIYPEPPEIARIAPPAPRFEGGERELRQAFDEEEETKPCRYGCGWTTTARLKPSRTNGESKHANRDCPLNPAIARSRKGK